MRLVGHGTFCRVARLGVSAKTSRGHQNFSKVKHVAENLLRQKVTELYSNNAVLLIKISLMVARLLAQT